MIRVFTFTENELREFSRAESIGDAVRKVRDGRADGLCIDSVHEFECVSYEVMPGRGLVVWYGEECHE